ncbi:MAG: rhodanese-like domain-containing protein [Chromatiales bacterium]
MRLPSLIGMILLVTAASAFGGAVNLASLPATKHTRAGLYLTSNEAFALVQQEGEKLLFIDVRTQPELMFVGMPTVVDANIPSLLLDYPYAFDENKSAFNMEPNPDFVRAVERRLQQKRLSKDAKVLVLCRSGDRSAKAADLLTGAGFTQVYSITDGFEGDKAEAGPDKGKRVVNGWKVSGLPWSYTLDKAKMYLPSDSH